MSITFPLILDLLIVVLLSATIGFSIVLNRRLNRLRENKDELDALVKGFADAAGRAETSVAGMKETAAKVADTLQKSIDRAQNLRDELQFMIEAADSLASRLEGSVGTHTLRAATGPSPAAIKAAGASRSRDGLSGNSSGGQPSGQAPLSASGPNRPAMMDSPKRRASGAPNSQAEAQHNSAHNAQHNPSHTPQSGDAYEPRREPRQDQRKPPVSSNEERQEPPPPNPPPPPHEARSRAERELLRALENLR
ncbi:hypothetical protein N825_21475 [Skermanella stibiiresistens SB22]|uniref:DUF6468 domain-containing protein n=1 Tax=Skermanella stibiiresistens SB22 TaxID=1385369 RepID=W9GX26_9PROT|nr:DUF6468 domain-containing protein [Skermanella stibiiresistens]EWY37161.1 hypothetical protein N825_21475 [Skermanella stibiiresistens SB22]